MKWYEKKLNIARRRIDCSRYNYVLYEHTATVVRMNNLELNKCLLSYFCNQFSNLLQTWNSLAVWAPVKWEIWLVRWLRYADIKTVQTKPEFALFPKKKNTFKLIVEDFPMSRSAPVSTQPPIQWAPGYFP
jgi:hypothetical protein